MGGKNLAIFAVLNLEAGRGPARLRRLVWDQEIAGSNPAAPTTKAAHICGRFFLCLSQSPAKSGRCKNNNIDHLNQVVEVQDAVHIEVVVGIVVTRGNEMKESK